MTDRRGFGHTKPPRDFIGDPYYERPKPSILSQLRDVDVLVVVFLVAIIVAASTAAIASLVPKDPASCKASISPPGADFSPRASIANAVYQYDASVSVTPPDAILAVGKDSIVVPSNLQFSMFDKSTLTRTEHFPRNGQLWNPEIDTGGDGHVVYDIWTQRIVYSMWQFYQLGGEVQWNEQDVTVAVANYAAPASPTVTAELIAADPITGAVSGVPTLNNAAQCAGKIVIFKQGGILSYDKALLAVQAGAVGMIFVPTSPIGVTAPKDTRAPLPLAVLSVSHSMGLAMISGLGQATLTILPNPIAYNMFNLAVSTGPSPKTDADWLTYILDVSADYPTVQLDFPKISVDEGSIYISVQAYNLSVSQDNPPSYAAIVFIIDKQPLIDGPSGIDVDYDVATLPDQSFLWPAVYQAPLSDQLLPMFFVGTNCQVFSVYGTTGTCDGNATALRIYTGEQDFQGIDALSSYIDVPFPTPMQFTPFYSYSVGYASQPPPIGAMESFADGDTVFSPIVRGNRLWCAVPWAPSESRAVTRWFELDLSRYLSHNEITIVQWGDLTHVANASTSFPAINVDVNGNMAVAFVLSSWTQPPTLAYAGRFASDPSGTVRVPYETPLASEYAYATSDSSGVDNIPRYGDYSGLVLDPTDGVTFYATVQHPSQLSSDNDGTTTQGWTLPVVSFKLERTTTPGGPKPALGPSVKVTPIEFEDYQPGQTDGPDQDGVIV